MRGLVWDTPQGKKTMRAGDHQAMQTMYAVQIKGGKFNIQSTIPTDKAIGPDACTKW